MYNIVEKLVLLILFLLLSLFKEAVHDANSDEDATNHGLGEDNHSLIFHHLYMSLSTITCLDVMNYGEYNQYWWGYCMSSHSAVTMFCSNSPAFFKHLTHIYQTLHTRTLQTDGQY